MVLLLRETDLKCINLRSQSTRSGFHPAIKFIQQGIRGDDPATGLAIEHQHFVASNSADPGDEVLRLVEFVKAFPSGHPDFLTEILGVRPIENHGVDIGANASEARRPQFDEDTVATTTRRDFQNSVPRENHSDLGGRQFVISVFADAGTNWSLFFLFLLRMRTHH